MNELIEMLERGEVPDFLTVMRAISEIADVWPCDDGKECTLRGQPGQRCLNCY